LFSSKSFFPLFFLTTEISIRKAFSPVDFHKTKPHQTSTYFHVELHKAFYIPHQNQPYNQTTTSNSYFNTQEKPLPPKLSILSTRMTPTSPLFLAALLAHLATAHVVLESPKPFKFPAYGPSNPLEPSGSDWPCKIPSGGKIQVDGEPTTMRIGDTQTASFSGLAVHGGGSCQFSLLPGFNPSKDNDDFRVIKSIEGGCVVANQVGNILSGAPDTFDFTLPSDLAPGDYTWAWTWQSRTTGEFYMNCAPITAVAGKQTRLERFKSASTNEKRGLSDLPAVFLEGLGDVTGTCKVDKGLQQAVKYPEPGSVVAHPEGTANLLKPNCNGNRHTSSSPVTETGDDKDATPAPVAESPDGKPIVVAEVNY
jgi:hypothetical protein